MTKALEIHNLHVSVDEKKILNGVSLDIKPGEVHALMGPNGSGKSTLAHALMGHPQYHIAQGNILLNGEDITHASPEVRARKGLFMAFQHPREIAGLPLAHFLREAYISRFNEKISVAKFRELLRTLMNELAMDDKFVDRPLNEGFSGGEKKKAEILQMIVLRPLYALLDETDSGLDIDALSLVSAGIKRLSGVDTALVIITHYQRILKFIEPDYVHIMIRGEIVKSGDKELAHELEHTGFKHITHDTQASRK